MPLKRGCSRRVISRNIRELKHHYKREGRIGRSRPPTAGKAAKQAAAVAYRKARESGCEPGEPDR
ncbi:MAG: hypothetical protein ABSH53_07940 [Holophaga sp.]|jgi:hypothetical protein